VIEQRDRPPVVVAQHRPSSIVGASALMEHRCDVVKITIADPMQKLVLSR
jgi:hypothetical protein